MYYGGWKDNKMSGHGVQQKPDGTKFVGRFDNDKRHGKGVLFKADGNNIIVGTWVDGKLEGWAMNVILPHKRMFKTQYSADKMTKKADVSGIIEISDEKTGETVIKVTEEEINNVSKQIDQANKELSMLDAKIQMFEDKLASLQARSKDKRAELYPKKLMPG